MTTLRGKIPVTRVDIAVQIAAALEAEGLSAENAMRGLNMPPWHYCRRDGFVPFAHICRLMDHGSRTLGSKTFGIRVSELGSFAEMGDLRNRAARADRLSGTEGCRPRPSFLRNDANWWLAEATDEVLFCRDGPRVFDFGEREMAHFAMGMMVQVARMGAGPNWRPSKIFVPSRDSMGLEKTDVFCDAEIVPTRTLTAIAIPRAVAGLPVVASTNPRLPTRGRTKPADDFPGSLHQVLATLLGERAPQIETAAEIAGMTVRSLQRRLANDGTTYSKLFEEARYSTAVKLLAENNKKIIDVGYSLGYSDPAHFTRAFRRFAGVSPREFRENCSVH